MSLEDKDGAVSYTHLDVYKRQGKGRLYQVKGLVSAVQRFL